MTEKDSGGDLSDLEKEIDSAVDNLLIAKDERSNRATQLPTQSPKASSTVQGAAIAERPLLFPFTQPQPQSLKTSPTVQRAGSTDNPVLAKDAQATREPARELREKLDAVEAQLLTLEWDLNTRNINKAITHLQDLRRDSHLENELDRVITLIQKVLYQLILDEAKLTPIALKFLQKSWRAVKGMTDERFCLEIDKEAVVGELLTEFQKLRIEEKTKEKPKGIDAQKTFTEVISRIDEREDKKPYPDTQLSLTEIDTFMNRLEKLSLVVNEEQKRWNDIHQEIINFKTDLKKKLGASQSTCQVRAEGAIGKVDESLVPLDDGAYRSSDREFLGVEKSPVMVVSLVKISGVIFGLPEKQIVRSFPIKKWVSDFCIAKGKVKLKDREIPLFNLCQVFKLKPSLEENPHVLLIRGRGNHPAAVIIDQALAREEIAYQPIAGKPYIFGQGVSRGGKVWLLDAEQISP
jgi:hypothetical protein